MIRLHFPNESAAIRQVQARWGCFDEADALYELVDLSGTYWRGRPMRGGAGSNLTLPTYRLLQIVREVS